MENAARDEDWKMCFTRLGPGLVLFARQWVHSRADAEDIVQETFVRFWRRQHSIDNKALLYATVRSVALDLLRRDGRRASLVQHGQTNREVHHPPDEKEIDHAEQVRGKRGFRQHREQRAQVAACEVDLPAEERRRDFSAALVMDADRVVR